MWKQTLFAGAPCVFAARQFALKDNRAQLQAVHDEGYVTEQNGQGMSNKRSSNKNKDETRRWVKAG